MHIVVCMKQVLDLEKIRIKPDTHEPVLEGVPVCLGDFEKNALEQAVRIKESLDDVTVTVVSVGSPKLNKTIMEALAIGADEAVILVDPHVNGSDAMGSAIVLANVIQKIGDCDLILLGEGSTDEYSGQVPSRLAEILDLPQVTYARELEVLDHRIRAVRDLEDMLESVEVELPALVSVTQEINQPRLPPLTAILKAGKKPLHVWSLEDINASAEEVGTDAAVCEELSNLAPAKPRKEMIFDEDIDSSVNQALEALEQEGVLDL
ncbi:MAG: electron transfer flavoprotein subunit beta/FixA family protein [Anaerolineales bacterium]|nr:electron transfer flavoprotein subunit beta/FixA family protein [Anaerolineales bacterium]